VDPRIHQAIQRHRGLRILRQDPWETLASFVLASFNNIKRIEGMIEALCCALGRPVAVDGVRSFTFPEPRSIAGSRESKLRQLGLGYRAPYLLATARRVAEGGLPIGHLRRVGYEKLKTALLACEGVGDKVADCVALFGFEKYEAFPVDIWMERVARRYAGGRPMTRGKVHAWARATFGPYAGYAQQYLYHDIRTERTRAGLPQVLRFAEKAISPAC